MDRLGTESPCVRNCCLDEQDICLGCFRSLREICEWSNADDERRQAILASAQDRQQEHRCRVNSRQRK